MNVRLRLEADTTLARAMFRHLNLLPVPRNSSGSSGRSLRSILRFRCGAGDELSHCLSFEERLAYLSLDGAFFMRQYGSRWRTKFSTKVLFGRKPGLKRFKRDLGLRPGSGLISGDYDGVVVHHNNPPTPHQCEDFDPACGTDNLILVRVVWISS